MAICAGWSSNLHLEADDIHNLPVFSRCLKLMSVEYSRPGQKHFQILLEYVHCVISRMELHHDAFSSRKMKKIQKSAVMIITRPPEIIACFKFVNTNATLRSSTYEDPLFVVFDSHPRPSHPHGAGLSFSTSIENTARTLSDSLPTMDFNPSDFQWQAQLLSNCSAHVYVAKHRRKDHDEAIVQSSLAILTLRARIPELKRENEMLGFDNEQLTSEVDRLRAAVRQEQIKAKQEASSSRTAFSTRAPRRSYGLISHAVAGPSRASGAPANASSVQKSGAYNRHTDTPSTAPAQPPRPARLSRSVNVSGAQSIFADNPPPVPSKTPPTYDDLDLEDKSSTDSDELWTQTTYLACQLQSAFDSEDQRIRQEHNELAQYIQATSQCSICLDELPEDDVAKVDECVHTMCRSCLREFVFSKIQEHRYPISCPMCTIATESKAQPGGTHHVAIPLLETLTLCFVVISRPLIEQLGISEEQSDILTEMELAEFTIQIHCRKYAAHPLRFPFI